MTTVPKSFCDFSEIWIPLRKIDPDNKVVEFGEIPSMDPSDQTSNSTIIEGKEK